MRIRGLNLPVIFLGAWLIILSGCVAKQVEKEAGSPVFYPPPPDLPRYQFLTAFSGSKDFDKNKSSALDSFLGRASLGVELKKPYGVALSKGNLYVVDTQSSVWRFNLVQEKLNRLAGDKGLGKLVQPINISIDEQGNKYVADPVRGAVIAYDKNDFYLKSYSAQNPWKPVDVEVYDSVLYAVDSTHITGGVVAFDLESGKMIDKIGQTGPVEHRLRIPTNLTFDDEGYLYVMDAGRFQIVKFDRDGHYRGYLGDPGDTPGFFGRPRGVAVDREGRIYAVDAAFDVVQVFAPNGQILSILGGPGVTPGTLTLPAGIAIDYDNVELFRKYAAPGFELEYLVLVASQFHDTNSVSVYGYGKMAGQRYLSDEELKEIQLEALKRKD